MVVMVEVMMVMRYCSRMRLCRRKGASWIHRLVRRMEVEVAINFSELGKQIVPD